jgi:hypothetical protein
MRTDALMELICLLPAYPQSAAVRDLMADYMHIVGVNVSNHEITIRLRRAQKKYGIKIVQWKNDKGYTCAAIDPASWLEAQKIGMEYAEQCETNRI